MIDRIVKFAIDRNINPDGITYKFLLWLDVHFGGPVDLSKNYWYRQSN